MRNRARPHRLRGFMYLISGKGLLISGMRMKKGNLERKNLGSAGKTHNFMG